MQNGQLVKPRAKNVNRVDLNYLEEPAPSYDDNKKKYRFSYAVKDGISGDDFSHTQKQENGAVQGSYKVHLPDGRVQIVKYTADDVHGYRADVSYEGEAQTAAVDHQVQVSAPIQVQPKSVFHPIFNPSIQIASERYTAATSSPNYVTHSIKAPRKYFRATTFRPIEYYKK